MLGAPLSPPAPYPHPPSPTGSPKNEECDQRHNPVRADGKVRESPRMPTVPDRRKFAEDRIEAEELRAGPSGIN